MATTNNIIKATKELQISDSPNAKRCPLCHKFRRLFLCKDCISSGHISRAKTKYSNWTYIEIKKKIISLEDDKQLHLMNCLHTLEDKQKSDYLLSKIRHAKERNRIVRLAVEDRRMQKNCYNNKLCELKYRNMERFERIKGYKNKSQMLEDYVVAKKYEIFKNREKLEKIRGELKRVVRLRIQQLFTYIFPITKIKPAIEMESSDEMVKELAEASQTTYIRDKWVYTDDSGEIKYCIVAPTLPGSGDYSAYHIWTSQNREIMPGPNVPLMLVAHNPAYRVSAGLTYAAQLLGVLCFFLNIRLPFKMSYSDFCSKIMSEQQFTRKTARLNANVIYLCITQNVDVKLLNANSTMHNIFQLVEDHNADLGREGPVDIDPQKVSALEKSLNGELLVGDDSDSDEGDSFTVEWEAVPHVQCPEVPAGIVTVQSTQMIATQQTSSMAGGLMNSAVAGVASIWRGFTGR